MRIISVKVEIVLDADNRSNNQICEDIQVALMNTERVKDVSVIDPHGRRITT